MTIELEIRAAQMRLRTVKTRMLRAKTAEEHDRFRDERDADVRFLAGRITARQMKRLDTEKKANMTVFRIPDSPKINKLQEKARVFYPPKTELNEKWAWKTWVHRRLEQMSTAGTCESTDPMGS